MYFPPECPCSPISPPSSEDVWDRLAQLACKPFASFKRCSLESLHLHPAQLQTPVSHLWVNDKDLRSLTSFLSSCTSRCLQPWTIWNPIQSQLSPSMTNVLLYHFSKEKRPLFEKCCSCANLADKPSPQGNPPTVVLKHFAGRLGPLLSAVQELLCTKRVSCSSLITPFLQNVINTELCGRNLLLEVWKLCGTCVNSFDVFHVMNAQISSYSINLLNKWLAHCALPNNL